MPKLDNVFEAAWSPDAKTLALTHIVTIPSSETVTGYEEDQRIELYDVASGRITERGVGSEPVWSGSGTLLAYWADDTTLWITRPGVVLPLAVLNPTQPDVRWVGETLLFWSGNEIRSWTSTGVATVARTAALTPRHPQDDVYFSPDGARFTVTRYFADGTTKRFLGTTSTGELAPFDDGGATFIEWAPVGETLLLRSASHLSVVDVRSGARSASLATASGTVHVWTADGRLATGAMSPTIPAGNAFDKLTLLGTTDVTTLPNLLGIRSFSPDGRFFTGVSRTGLYSTQLEIYRCGAPDGEATDLANDASVRERAAAIEADQRRFVRPASAAITQFVQGRHTGVDVAAPYGTVIVAADDGVVDAVGYVAVGGRRVCVMHADALESCDYHTALPLVAIGEHVVRGQPVALMGLTGETTGPHVHWEAKQDGNIVDPLER